MHHLSARLRPLLGAALVAAFAAGCEPAPEDTPEPEPPAPAQDAGAPLPLPQFTGCASTSHPVLPEKWSAVALLQDFFLDSLAFGKFVYDESVGAFRFTLADRYGVDVDFLVTADRRLYLLEGGELPTQCTYLTPDSPFTVPSRDWLDAGAVCVGQAPILGRDLAWWKTPSGEGANWLWYGTGNRLPFRSMYYADARPADPVPIYEHFTFNYFPAFSEVASTNLAQILELCAATGDVPAPPAELSFDDVESLLSSGSYPTPSEAGIARVQEWIPGLTECSSPSSLPPPWPHQVQGTVFMTAVSFPPNPFPTRVYYDWTRPAQNTTLYYYPPTATDYAQVALLTGDTGYIRIEDEHGVVSMCQQALPGPQVPTWQSVDGCECRAEIAPGTVLNPGDEPTKVLWCPTDLSAQQVFWTWYSDSGTPIVFMQSNSSPTAGTGLNLADYYHWEPGSVAPPGTFDLPPACEGKPKIDVPKACHNCHLPTN